jgi:cyclopropane fatty-acyl-phospholipid synthase-like methyltransferase
MKLNLLTQKVYSFFLESYLGIQTTGYVAPTVKWGVSYAPLPYHIIRRILDHLSMKRDDVFVDIGSGKGRVVCCACRLPLRKVVAIEVNESLLKLAVANSNKLRDRQSPLEALAIPAEEYDYIDATVIYLYNPFDRPTMDKVFARIDESFRRNPRPLRVVYANPKHEEPLRQTGWLVKREEWPATEFPGWGCSISIWSSEVRG